MPEYNLILGPPGTGKTTTMLELVDFAIKRKIPTSKIGYFTFTTKAANEAVTRAAKKFGKMKKSFPYFSTLHALAYRLIGIRREDVFEDQMRTHFGNLMGLDLRDGTPDMALLSCVNMARAKGITLKEEWRNGSYEFGWFAVNRVGKGLAEFKRVHGVVDFTDMLAQAAESQECPPFDLLIIDEAQDLSAVQWDFVKQLCRSSKEVYFAGDDDQAIHEWCGADAHIFRTLDIPKIVLGQSYRVPRAVQDIANRISSRIKDRYDKQWEARDEQGAVHRPSHFQYIDFSEGSWLILARHEFLLHPIRDELRSQGVYYAMKHTPSVSPALVLRIKGWEALRSGELLPIDEAAEVLRSLPKRMRGAIPEGKKEVSLADLECKTDAPWHEAMTLPSRNREYLMAMMRSGEPLTGEPRIILSTIHSAKGGEADNVVLLPDITKKTEEAMIRNPDPEHRVWYVGATRAKQNLYILDPQTMRHYDI